MPRFVIDLGDLDMSKADQDALAGDLQKLALGRVADLRFEKPIGIYFPRDWWGLILDPNWDGIFGRAEAIGKTIGRG